MSVMSKFLNQKCMWEQSQRVSRGETVLDTYGDVQYEAPVQVKCRRERIIRDVQTGSGAILRSSTRYFIDNSTPLRADDRLDGHAVLELEEYVDSSGHAVGYECYV